MQEMEEGYSSSQGTNYVYINNQLCFEMET